MTDKKTKKPELTIAQWWRAKEHGKDPHELLDNLVSSIEGDQQGRYEAYKEYERLFGASVIDGNDSSHQAVSSDELSQNELQNALETLWAQVFKNKLVPGVSVSEADWDEWDRARSYSRWLEGALDDAEVYEEAVPQAGMCSLVHGSGIIRVGWKEVDDKTAQVIAWSVNPKHCFVDRLEAKHGKPRSMYFKDHIDRWVLMERYGTQEEGFYGSVEERRAGLFECQANDDDDVGTNQCDMLTVREIFRLPSGHKSKDGRHVIWVKGCTLVDEPFTWDTLPVAVMRFGCKLEGYWGESAVKRLAPTQKNLNKLNLKIDESQDIMGVPRILCQTGNIPTKSQIDDVPGGILEVANIGGVKEWNAQCVTPELYQDRDSLPHKMRSLLGLSDFEATSQLPPGLRDVGAPFMERFVEQGQARHAMFHAEYEKAVVKLSDLFMRQAEDLQEMGYDVVVKSPADSHNKSSIEELSFKEVTIDRKKLKLKVQPMSDLPQSFSGKVDAIQKLNDANVPVDPKTAMRMIEIPDLHGATDQLVSDEEIIFKNLSWMCKNGEYLPPMPFDNLDLIVQMTTRFINRYRVRNGADGEVVGLLAQYIDDAIALKKGLGGPDPNAPPMMNAPSTMGALGMPMPGMAPGGALPGQGPPGLMGPGAPPGMAPQGPVDPMAGMMAPMGPPGVDANPVAPMGSDVGGIPPV